MAGGRDAASRSGVRRCGVPERRPLLARRAGTRSTSAGSASAGSGSLVLKNAELGANEARDSPASAPPRGHFSSPTGGGKETS